MKNIKYFLLLSALAVSGLAAGQTNPDFEMQNFTGWTGFSGMPNGYTNPLTGVTYGISPASVNAYTSNSPHLIVNSNFNGITCNGATPVGQGMYSALINFTSGSNHASGIEQSFPVTPSNLNYVFSWSVFLVDANHAATEEAFFRAEVLDQSNGIIFQKVVYPGMPNSPLVSCNINNNYYTPWECDTVALSAYIGQSVTVRFTAADCFFGDHDGYAFVDGACLTTGTTGPDLPGTDAVFPNPSAGIFFVRLANTQPHVMVVRSVEGKELLRETSCTQGCWIDLSSCSSGFYLLEITDASGNRKTHKLIKS